MLPPADAVFATARCQVRPTVVADAAGVLAIRAAMPWDPPTRDLAATVAMIEEVARREPGEAGWRQFAVLSDGVLIGDIGVNIGVPSVRQAELGFAFAPAARGYGLAQESVGALVDRLFAAGLHRIAATTDARNLSAQRLLTRLRFRQEAHFVASWPCDAPGGWSDEFAYARLARE